jgi:hypothetical protein
MWLIPPQQNSTMHDFADPLDAVVAACVCKYCGNVKPAAPHPMRNAVRRRIRCPNNTSEKLASGAGIVFHSPLSTLTAIHRIKMLLC